jgi:predicted dehydrogenase
MNIIVVGVGAIGRERIRALELLGEKIIAICDPKSALTDYPYYNSLKQATNTLPLEEIDWVFICTPHHETPAIVEYALSCGLNILVEKPFGRTIEEYDMLMKYHSDEKINVGFNYRFYSGVWQLLIDIKERLFGNLISVNMILGLGDAPGTEKTWRLSPVQAGGGAYLDPGCHLIDLAMLISDNSLRYRMGDTLSAYWHTGFEEEWHCLAYDQTGAIYNIQSSKVRWRNNFRIEVNGTDGYGIVEGRGRNYGPQTYRRGKRWGWQSGLTQKDSEELVMSYDAEGSFLEETRAVLSQSDSVIKPATHEDMKRVLEFLS